MMALSPSSASSKIWFCGERRDSGCKGSVISGLTVITLGSSYCALYVPLDGHFFPAECMDDGFVTIICLQQEGLVWWCKEGLGDEGAHLQLQVYKLSVCVTGME